MAEDSAVSRTKPLHGSPAQLQPCLRPVPLLFGELLEAGQPRFRRADRPGRCDAPRSGRTPRLIPRRITRGAARPGPTGPQSARRQAGRRLAAGAIEALRVPANPLDVLAQQVVAATAVTPGTSTTCSPGARIAPFAVLPRSAYDATLDLLSGPLPIPRRVGRLRPRLVWDRTSI